MDSKKTQKTFVVNKKNTFIKYFGKERTYGLGKRRKHFWRTLKIRLYYCRWKSKNITTTCYSFIKDPFFFTALGDTCIYYNIFWFHKELNVRKGYIFITKSNPPPSLLSTISTSERTPDWQSWVFCLLRPLFRTCCEQ